MTDPGGQDHRPVADGSDGTVGSGAMEATPGLDVPIPRHDPESLVEALELEPTETAPIRLDFRRKVRPGTCALRTGGSSSPTKSVRLSPGFAAGNTPIYDPESRVSIPEILPAKRRGLTTQKTVPSVS